MGIRETREYRPLTFEDDPDDDRPRSELAFANDPARPGGDFVEGLTVFCERVAPGDRIPLHEHTIEEVLFDDGGRIEARLGSERREVSAGAIVFIPALTPHAFRNVGESVAQIHVVFPAREVSIRYLERNPAPGTEGDEPRPPVAFDVRELVEGDPAKAVRPLRKEDFLRGRP